MKPSALIILFISFFSIHARAENVVFWLSIDGLKPSYLEKANAPKLKKMMEHSLYTKQLRPVFPSITFPSHCSLATGVTVKEHGIPSNSFYDVTTGKLESYPGDAHFLQAEPIWQTAKRQGLRTAVLNWPLSHRQTGENKSDFFVQFRTLFPSENVQVFM